MEFRTLKTAVAAQFERMQSLGPLLRVGAEKDALWDTYLGAFPAGTNPIFRQRTDHDCSCCKNFIRSMGNIVAIIDGKIETLWDCQAGEYQAVVDQMAAAVRAAAITDAFLHDGKTAGVDKTFEQLTEQVQTWEHFFVNVPAQYVARRADIPTRLGEVRTTQEVLLRGVREITDEAVDTVLELIANRSLYRGEEHAGLVTAFKALKAQFAGLPDTDQAVLAWSILPTTHGALARIRGSVIGSLLVDLSEDRDLDAAVSSFEAKVAPVNYKRPTSLVTQAMVDRAKATVEELGLTSALERRHARLTDITVNNILFADRSARAAMGGAFDGLPTAEKVPALDKIEEVPVERFISDILPLAASVEVMVEGRHASNKVSLIAPVDPTAGGLFKWANNFSWSYAGEVADAIKERVKQAGGNVTGDLCCRLAWFNYDDLDLHMRDATGAHIFFGAKRPAGTTGQLDVDMNAGGGQTREPVENIFYGDRSRMAEGTYELRVHQYAKRESADVGFQVDIDYLGEVHHFRYDQAVPTNAYVTVAKFNYSHRDGLKILESLPATVSNTQAFAKANVIMLSPNHWDGQGVGNRHYFFMLEGWKDEGPTRGFYNEFLKEDLNTHRKVFEIVGSKMKVPDAAEQLCGLGFSSTQRNTLVCRVKGSFTRTIKIVF
jgi:hypothetical protein